MESEHIKNTNYINTFCYKSKEFYLLTIPKIASSWVYQLYEYHPEFRDNGGYDINMDNNNVDLHQLTLAINPNNDTSKDVFQFYNDWNKLLKGNTPDIDFIFLMRNPVEKLISGVMQDIILNKLSQENIFDNITNYRNIHNLNEFKKFNYDNIQNNEREWWFNPNLIWSEIVSDVMSHIINNMIDNWMSDVENLSQLKNGHKTINLFLYYKILFNSKLDLNKIKILDIDSENLYKYLTNTYSIEINKNLDEKINLSASFIKNLVKKSLRKYENILSVLLETDSLLYCDLHNKLYSTDFTLEKLWYEK